jgi:hypothetical protein
VTRRRRASATNARSRSAPAFDESLAESLAIDRNIKEFARGVIERAQREGIVKPLDPKVLMELMFGAFVGMMRAHYEGRIVLADELIRGAEQACWDAVAVHEPPR